jgi:hypothetical protein
MTSDHLPLTLFTQEKKKEMKKKRKKESFRRQIAKLNEWWAKNHFGLHYLHMISPHMQLGLAPKFREQ